MTDQTSRAEQLLAALREAETPAESPSRAAGRRRRVVARLEELSLERATSRRVSRRWRVWGALALAATVVLSIGLGWVVRDRVETGSSQQVACAARRPSGATARRSSSRSYPGPAESASKRPTVSLVDPKDARPSSTRASASTGPAIGRTE